MLTLFSNPLPHCIAVSLNSFMFDNLLLFRPHLTRIDMDFLCFFFRRRLLFVPQFLPRVPFLPPSTSVIPACLTSLLDQVQQDIYCRRSEFRVTVYFDLAVPATHSDFPDADLFEFNNPSCFFFSAFQVDEASAAAAGYPNNTQPPTGPLFLFKNIQWTCSARLFDTRSVTFSYSWTRTGTAFQRS